MLIFRVPQAMNVHISAVDSSVAFSEETVSGVLRLWPPRVCCFIWFVLLTRTLFYVCVAVNVMFLSYLLTMSIV